MGFEDLKAISSHSEVEVVALCDVDSNALKKAKELFPKADTYKDYRRMLSSNVNKIDAVIVSTPDHTHAPASIMAMKMDKHVYCQKPLTHHVSEARTMSELAEEKNLVTQMGIQVHSFYDYKLATLLIQSGIIGKVSTVRAWSPKIGDMMALNHKGKILYLKIWIGIFGLELRLKDHIKTKFIIHTTGESLLITDVGP